MNRFRRICTTAIISLLAGWISLPGFAQDTYPKPVSEYAEETSPGTMVFLSYPKYYKNVQGKLAEVQTSLVPSTDPAWDYEVSQGIWQLKVKKDGAFQAEHEGDIFTYRFNSLGTGRGSGFKPFEWGRRTSPVSSSLATPSAGAMSTPISTCRFATSTIS